jgi:hypothetical protein
MPVLPLEDERAPKRVWEWVIGLAVPLVCAVMIAYRLHPGLLLRNSTTNGGDMGAHVYWPWFLEHNWFLSGRLQGWSPDWYSGFPIGQYYFPFPAILTAALDLILPYNVAFKLVTVAGPISLPIAAYAFAEQLEFPWPASPLCAAATLFYEFDLRHHAGTDTWTIYGGNLASSLAGEFSFALALSLALFFIAALAYTLRTGRRPWLPAVLLACCVMSHIVVAFFAAFLGLVVWLCYRPRRTWRIAIPVSVVGLLLTATWSFPLVATNSYTSSMRYEKVTQYMGWLFGPGTEFKLFGAHIPLPTPVWLWLLVLAGLLGGAYWLRRSTLIIVVWAVAFGVAFRVWPQDQAVWNTRFIPFYFLALAFMAALGVAELARLLDYCARAAAAWVSEGARLDTDVNETTETADTTDTTDVAATKGELVVLAVPVDDADAPASAWTPLGPPPPAPDDNFAPAWSGRAAFDTDDPYAPIDSRMGREQRRRQRFLSSLRFAAVIVVVSTITLFAANRQGGDLAASWASWNYSGYQAKPAWPEYNDLMTKMGALGKQRGCGRALWEPSDNINNYGTTLALELLPYWTNGCIGSQEGLYFESSATKDAHFLTVSELAETPSNPVRGLVYGTTADFERGIDHARLLGVRYLMFSSSQLKSLADTSKQLTKVLTTPDLDGADPKGWSVYEIHDWGLVTGLDTEPVVATMHSGTKTSCLPGAGDLGPGELDTRLNAWECATDALWMDPTDFSRPVVSSGPKSWQRVDLQPRTLKKIVTPPSAGSVTMLRAEGPAMLAPVANTPVRHITPAKVSNVHETVSKISFHVDQIGKPVEVRTSYFPNWQVHGADGPYRVAPNLMIVIPRRHDVQLDYGLTSADWLGRIGTAAGVVLLVLMMWRWGVVPRSWTVDAPRDGDDDDGDSAGDADTNGEADGVHDDERRDVHGDGDGDDREASPPTTWRPREAPFEAPVSGGAPPGPGSMTPS